MESNYNKYIDDLLSGINLPSDEEIKEETRKEINSLNGHTIMSSVMNRLKNEGKLTEFQKKRGISGGYSAKNNKKGLFSRNKETWLEDSKSGGISTYEKKVGIFGLDDEAKKERSKKCGEGARKKLSEPILAFDYKSGNFIKEFSSSREACRELDLKSAGNVSMVLNNKKNHYKGYTFKYKE